MLQRRSCSPEGCSEAARLVHDGAQGGWVLLAPARLFKADAIAAEIIKRCTGELTFGELVDQLAKS